MYSLADYLWMISDRARTAAYATALRAQVAPGMRVLEVGAGLGFFSVIAAKAGAARVDAVETNPIVHLGPKIAAANGCADRIHFHHHDAALVTIDEPADLLITDLRGPTPFGHRALETIIAARRRLLRSGGTMIARRDTLFVAPTQAPVGVRQEIHAARGAEGVDLHPAERVMADVPMRFSIGREDVLAEGQPWLQIDYQSITATDLDGVACCEIQRPGQMDGLAVWFEADLGAGVTFSTEPGSAIVAYKAMFIPLQEPVAVMPSETVKIRLAVRHLHVGAVWEWQVWRIDHGSGEETQLTRQSSLAEIVIDPAALVATSDDVQPQLGPRGRALRELLGWMDGRHTIATLTERLQLTVPDLFPDRPGAAAFVRDCVYRMERHERNAY